MMFDLTMEGAIARLRLGRPEARNAIPVGGWSQLADTAEQASRSGARVLILSGTPGGAFCAGADLAGFDAFRDQPAARIAFRDKMRDGIDRLRELPIPTIAVIEGACYGAGTAVAMACDIRFAGPQAQIAITPAKLGISYPQQDVHRLVSLVGPGHASRLLLSTRPISGAEAERIGLVERFCAEGLLERVEHLAAAIAANDPASLHTLKRGIRMAADGIMADPEQDRVFDDLLGSDALFDRLAAHRGRSR